MNLNLQLSPLEVWIGSEAMMSDPNSTVPTSESSEDIVPKKIKPVRMKVILLITFIVLISISATTWICWDLIKAWATQLLIQPLGPGKG